MGAELKTILVVVPTLSGGGAERAVSWLTREWSRDHRVITAVFNDSRRAYEIGGALINLDAAASHGSLRRLYFAARRVLLLRRLIRDRRPGRIFGFMESANIPLILAALSAGAQGRVTLSVRCNPAMMRWFHKLCAAALYRFSGGVALVSHGAAREFARFSRLDARKLRVLYSPLPLGEIRALGGAFPPEWDALSDRPYFFAAGRLVPGKDFARMIRLFAALDRPGLRLFIAGEGPERAALQACIESLGLSDRVRLLGRVENPFVFMRHALALLMTSRHEGFPMVILEAFACGCPVTAFDCDFGPAEAVAGGACGFIVPLDDEEGYVACLERLASDPALRERMGAAATARAADFDARAIAPQWLSPPGGAVS